MTSEKKYYNYIIFFLFGIISLWFTTSLINESPYQDLRTRAFASRYASADKSPYFYSYNTQDNINLFNSTQRQQNIVNDFTGTPTVLLITHFIHKMPLYITAIFWFVLNMASLWFIQLLLINKTNNNLLKLCIAAFSLVAGWRLHCSAGQIYILYTLFAVLGLYFYQQKKFIVAAILLALLITCRLPFAILILPLLIWSQNKKMLQYLTVSVLVIITLTLICFGAGIWEQYFSAMQYYALENAKAIPEINKTPLINIPTKTEGVYNIITPSMEQYFTQISPDIFSVQKLLVSNNLPYGTFFLIALFALYVLVLFIFINTFNRNFYLSKQLFFLYILVLTFTVDYFLPALRFNYNFVQFLLLIAFITFNKFQVNKGALCLLVIGIFMNIVKLPIPEAYSVGEILCVTSVLVVLITNKQFATNSTFELNLWVRNLLSYLRLQPKLAN